MKATKYLAIALAVVVILASISWVLRNSIIERLSGPALAKYGVAVTDVSLDALATEAVTISYLELEHENGTVIAIEDLTLPLGTASTGINRYVTESVTIDVPCGDEHEPLALAELIVQLLSVPDVLPNTEVIVNELNVSTYPAVQHIRWSLIEERQKLTANLGAVSLSLQIDAKDATRFEGKISLRQTALKAPEQSITTEIRQSEEGIKFIAASVLDLRVMGMIATSIAASLGSTLAGIEFANGTAILELDAELPFDMNRPVSASATLMPTAPFELAYSVGSGVNNVVSVRSASPIKLEFTYPESQWSISEEQASLSMSYEDWNDIAVSIAKLSCTNGPDCFMNLDVSMDNADLTFATASRFELAATQDIVFGEDGVRVLIRPGAELELAGMSVSGTALAGLNAVLMSAATLDLSESGWGFAAESLDANIESLALDNNVEFSAPASLRHLSVSDGDRSISMNAEVDAASGELTWDERMVALPRFNGDVSLQDGEMVAGLMTVGLHSDAKIQAEHNLGSHTGQISVEGVGLSFVARKLSARISPWVDDWDITAGTFSADLQMNWQYPDSGRQLDGQFSVSMTDLAGAYSDTAFAGLSTAFEAEFDSATGITVSPAQIKIDLVEVGLPIENNTADYTLNPNTLSVDVENLQMHAFGGVVKADPFTYALENESNALLLRAESIELTELLSLKEFEAIELSGRIGAELPVIIEGDQISILDGMLTGEAPGGVIRYQPEVVSDDTGTSAIGIVTEALSNFEYETLTSTVGYSEDGDLILQMRLAGRNPDLEDNRPVILNLGVESNIPEMLRSLQAARAVEEILEQRIKK